MLKFAIILKAPDNFQTQGLGLEYARHLVKNGCKHLVLASKSGLLESTLLQEFATSCTTIHVLQANSAEATASLAVLHWAHENLQAVQQYVHAAGVSGFALMPDVSDNEFNEVCRPKVSRRMMFVKIVMSVHNNECSMGRSTLAWVMASRNYSATCHFLEKL